MRFNRRKGIELAMNLMIILVVLAIIAVAVVAVTTKATGKAGTQTEQQIADTGCELAKRAHCAGKTGSQTQTLTACSALPITFTCS